jgi:hypothetical protein
MPSLLRRQYCLLTTLTSDTFSYIFRRLHSTMWAVFSVLMRAFGGTHLGPLELARNFKINCPRCNSPTKNDSKCENCGIVSEECPVCYTSKRKGKDCTTCSPRPLWRYSCDSICRDGKELGKSNSGVLFARSIYQYSLSPTSKSQYSETSSSTAESSRDPSPSPDPVERGDKDTNEGVLAQQDLKHKIKIKRKTKNRESNREPIIKRQTEGGLEKETLDIEIKVVNKTEDGEDLSWKDLKKKMEEKRQRKEK